MAEEKKYSKQMLGKIVVSKSGKKFGIVNDMMFEIRTGELIYLLLKQQTSHVNTLDLEKTRDGQYMLPFSSVISIADFVVVAEEDIV